MSSNLIWSIFCLPDGRTDGRLETDKLTGQACAITGGIGVVVSRRLRALLARMKHVSDGGPRFNPGIAPCLFADLAFILYLLSFVFCLYRHLIFFLSCRSIVSVDLICHLCRLAVYLIMHLILRWLLSVCPSWPCAEGKKTSWSPPGSNWRPIAHRVRCEASVIPLDQATDRHGLFSAGLRSPGLDVRRPTSDIRWAIGRIGRTPTASDNPSRANAHTSTWPYIHTTRRKLKAKMVERSSWPAASLYASGNRGFEPRLGLVVPPPIRSGRVAQR